MYQIRVGRRLLNLEYLIMAEEGDPRSPVPPGAVRVTMCAGKEFDLVGPDAEEFLRRSAPTVRADEDSGGGHASMAVLVRPGEGVAPGPSRQRKQGR